MTKGARLNVIGIGAIGLLLSIVFFLLASEHDGRQYVLAVRVPQEDVSVECRPDAEVSLGAAEDPMVCSVAVLIDGTEFEINRPEALLALGTHGPLSVVALLDENQKITQVLYVEFAETQRLRD